MKAWQVTLVHPKLLIQQSERLDEGVAHVLSGRTSSADSLNPSVKPVLSLAEVVSESTFPRRMLSRAMLPHKLKLSCLKTTWERRKCQTRPCCPQM